MTDRETLIAMFARAGLRRHEGQSYERGYTEYADGDLSVVDGGYGNFFVTFAFNDDGSLKQIGAWE